MLKGKIIKNISNSYVVKSGNLIYECKARGRFRNSGLIPLVGDNVLFDEKNNYILEILPRDNELNRPHISNIDIALIVASLKAPDLSLNLLDKELISIFLADIEPVICFTKLDLASKFELEELSKLSKYYEGLGIKVFTNTEISNMLEYLKDKYVVLTGQTGAGKSSLINRIDPNKNLQIGEISAALGRGKHTTRHTEFHEIKNIFIADTPGFSSLDLSNYSQESIRDAFLEFKDAACEYRDCMHLKETNCDVKNKVNNNIILKSRYENYCNFIK